MKKLIFIFLSLSSLFLVGIFSYLFFWMLIQSIYPSHPVNSESMEPTYMVGEAILYHNPHKKPSLGDIVEFECVSDSCKKLYSHSVRHRLVDISPEGCMQIVGDNPKYAETWEKLPCFMPDDIHILGVVRKVPFIKPLTFGVYFEHFAILWDVYVLDK